MSGRNSIAETLSSVYSYLPIFDEVVDHDPYRSRNTVAHAHQAHQRGLFARLTHRRHLGEGAVFDVHLYELKEKETSRLYAVKKTKTAWDSSGTDQVAVRPPGRKSLDHVHLAFKEIQIISNLLLRQHPNIVTIIGWDWANNRIPVVIVEFAEAGTLETFLQSNGPKLTSSARRGLCLDIACGLTALHAADVAHGDVKLANVLVFTGSSGSLTAKLSDFSHAVFGLSQRRRSTYPGSRLYNAPEVRNRNALVSSERIPLCESFSYGLVVWEILQNGLPFLHGQSLVSDTPSHGDASETQIEEILMCPRSDDLLKRAMVALSSMANVSIPDKSLFYRIFNLTLRDQPDRRKDLTMIAMTLDITDSAEICHYSTQTALRPLAVWDFDPWAKVIPQAKFDFVTQIRSITDGPLQPDHAEIHLILSRCYAEGYGVEVQVDEVIKHLLLAAQADSAEATCMLEISKPISQHWSNVVARRLASNATSQAVSQIGHMLRSGENAARTTLIDYIRAWLSKTTIMLSQEKFSWKAGERIASYSWSDNEILRFFTDVERNGQLVCDVMISYPTILAPTNTATFLEVCARHGFTAYLHLAIQVMDDLDYAVSSWGDFNDISQMLLIESAKGGRTEHLRALIRNIKQLLQDGLITGHWGSATGESPLHFISFLQGTASEIERIVRELQELGFDIDSAITTRSWLSPFGIEIYGTPMQMAVRSGCIRTLDILLTCGAKNITPSPDRQSPLELAASLQRADMVAWLLQKSTGSSRWHDHALRAIGVPSKRGWYDRLTSNSFDPNHQALGATLTAIEESLRSQATDPWFLSHGWSGWLSLRDGSAITDAITAGQRDADFIRELLNLGLGPTTDQGRFSLLSIVCAIPVPEIMRKPLLELFFGGRQKDQYEGYTRWASHWPRFLKEFRYSSSADQELQSMPMLHLWATLGDVVTISVAVEQFSDTMLEISSMVDGHSRTFPEVAIDVGSYELYTLLTGLKLRDLDEDIRRAERHWPGIGPNPILHQLIFEQSRRQEQEHLRLIGRASGKPCKGRWPIGFWREVEEEHWGGSDSVEYIDRLEEYANWILSHYQTETRKSQAEYILMTSLRIRLIRHNTEWLSRSPSRVTLDELCDLIWECVRNKQIELPLTLQRRYNVRFIKMTAAEIRRQASENAPGSDSVEWGPSKAAVDSRRLGMDALRKLLKAYIVFESTVPTWTKSNDLDSLPGSFGSENVCAWLERQACILVE